MDKRAAINEQELETLTALFRLLSDKTRLQILLLLSEGERNVSTLCHQLGLPQPTVSHHLGLLRMSNIIANRRAGKQVFYQFNGRLLEDQGNAMELAAGMFEVRIQPRPPGDPRGGHDVSVSVSH